MIYIFERIIVFFFKAYYSSITGSIFNKIQELISDGNIDFNTDFNVTMAWNDFSMLACTFGNADCEAKALEYFNKWQKGEK